MVKKFSLEANQGTNFTFQDCDMTHSGPTGREGEYRLRGTEIITSTSHCMAIYNRPVLSRRYKIEARFRQEHGTLENGYEHSHMGFLFKYKNTDNYIIIIVRYSAQHYHKHQHVGDGACG